MTLSDEQRTFLTAPHLLAVLSTTGPGGWPHAVPIWYAPDGDDLLMIIRRGSQKHRNLERDPRAMVVVDRRERPYYALMLRCTVVEDDAAVPEVRAGIAARYLPPSAVPGYVESRRGSDSLVIRLTPVRAAEYRGSRPTR